MVGTRGRSENASPQTDGKAARKKPAGRPAAKTEIVSLPCIARHLGLGLLMVRATPDAP
jgi:hypothetical protein